MILPTARLAVLLCLVALCVAACTQVARRPQAGARPWWEEDGNSPQPEDVQQDTSDTPASAPRDRTLLATSASVDSTAADTILAAIAGLGDSLGGKPRTRAPRRTVTADSSATPSAAVLKARRSAYEARTRQDQERVQQVNEYAFWCLERGMWDEARIHLEQAVEQDSLSASLHSNLGILYERMGERDRARSEYELATQLAPRKRLYQSNLRRLRAAGERRGSRVDSLDSDEPHSPLSDDRLLPEDSVQPKRARGDADRELP